jgi:hypothetical protein
MAALPACQVRQDPDSPVQSHCFELGDIVKADVDMVTEVNVRQSLA